MAATNRPLHLATLRALASYLVIALLGSALTASPVAADTGRASPNVHPLYLLALGDSLAAGYQPIDGTTILPPIDPETHLRDRGYPGSYASDVARSRHFELIDLGCPGETTVSFSTTPALPQCGTLYAAEFSARSQLAAARVFLARHPNRVGIVTFDLGADDLTKCTSKNSIDVSCLEQHDSSAILRLHAILQSIVVAARRDDPLARVIAMNLYDPYLAFVADPGGAPASALADESLAATDLFNAQLDATYRNAGVQIANAADAFGIDDATSTSTFDGRLFPTNVANVCRLTWMCPSSSSLFAQNIHPNLVGYLALARAFEASLRR